MGAVQKHGIFLRTATLDRSCTKAPDFFFKDGISHYIYTYTRVSGFLVALTTTDLWDI